MNGDLIIEMGISMDLTKQYYTLHFLNVACMFNYIFVVFIPILNGYLILESIVSILYIV